MANDKQRPDKLLVSTVATTGKWSSKTQKGAAYLTIQKSFNAEYTQLAVEVDHTSGVGPFKTHHQHQQGLINISFGNADGSSEMWSGKSEDLRKMLFDQQPGFQPDEDSQIKSIETVHTGGNIYNDVIILKDGTIIRISEGAVGVYKDEKADEDGNSIGMVYYGND